MRKKAVTESGKQQKLIELNCLFADIVLWGGFVCLCVVAVFLFSFLKNSVTRQDANFVYLCMLQLHLCASNEEPFYFE